MERKEKILIVDDDPDIVEAVGMMLEAHGYEVATAVDGIEALASLRAEKPDLMILDLLMPKMDGFAVCKELQDPRWTKHRVPILILSSVREDASRRRYELETGLQLGVDDYVEKPISQAKLLERVGKLIARIRAAGQVERRT